ncbi:hypothetical protein KSP40_PGU003891 [Platanthera guangdongensis]|uniref:Uncharacterized protein n=1 Tax=Platanthera guangdongensis TaxID=2320717 RepID=A0ABR2MZB1_9ASPA
MGPAEAGYGSGVIALRAAQCPVGVTSNGDAVGVKTPHLNSGAAISWPAEGGKVPRHLLIMIFIKY